MVSSALTNFEERRKDIDRILQAHGYFVRFYRAENRLRTAGHGLDRLAAAIRELGASPRPGRPPNLEALNRAAIVLLSAHLEGYIEDVYSEAATVLLEGKVKNLEVLVKNAQDSFQNPRPRAIEQLFGTIGLPGILDGISWRRANNDSVRRRLGEFLTLRNDVAHGDETNVHKSKVQYYSRFTKLFAENMDRKVGDEVASSTSTPHW